MLFMSLFGFFNLLSFKTYHPWMVIAVFLSIPSLVHSQPPEHFDSSSLSPTQKGEFLLAQSLNDEALRLYQSLIDEGKGDGYAFRGMVRAYKNMDKLKEAEAWIESFLEGNQNSSPAFYALGYMYYLKSNINKCWEN